MLKGGQTKNTMLKGGADKKHDAKGRARQKALRYMEGPTKNIMLKGGPDKKPYAKSIVKPQTTERNNERKTEAKQGEARKNYGRR